MVLVALAAKAMNYDTSAVKATDTAQQSILSQRKTVLIFQKFRPPFYVKKETKKSKAQNR